MRILLYLVSLIWLFIGAALLFAPETIRKVIEQLIGKIKNTKLLAIVPFIVSLILLSGAGSTAFPMFPQVLGVIALLKGAAELLFSKEKIMAIFSWWLGAPELAYRLSGLLVGGLGLILYKIIV